MPLAALFGSRLGAAGAERAGPRRRRRDPRRRRPRRPGAAAARPSVALTLPPQILVGIGLSLVLSALTETALAGRAPQAIHGGWTISARHAGVVIGLLALTPIFTHDIAGPAPATRSTPAPR